MSFHFFASTRHLRRTETMITWMAAAILLEAVAVELSRDEATCLVVVVSPHTSCIKMYIFVYLVHTMHASIVD